MAQDVMQALIDWARNAEDRRSHDFETYVHGIAEARYVMRKVTRIVDDEAKKHGLDPLEHQAMLQAFGAGSNLRTVSQLADRLDVAPALASRVVNSLANKELILRRSAENDKRVTMIEVSEAGEAMIRRIDRDVHIHMEYFQAQLTDDQRMAALAIFTFHLGLGSPTRSESLLSLELAAEAQ